MKSRRQFIKIAGGALSSGVFIRSGSTGFFNSPGSRDIFSLGLAGNTFREFSLEETIEMIKRLGIVNFSVKDIHMPMDSSGSQISSVMEKFKTAGINVYAVGVVYMTSQASVDQAFEYTRMAGVKMIIGAPDYNLLPYVEKKVKSYDIRLAIHNHGPDNPLYPNADDIWKNIRELDSRIGICIDIGHTRRDGKDPSADIMKYSKRIFDVHIKDVDKAVKDGKTVEMGRGIIDIPGVISTLRKTGFNGKCSIEYDKDPKDPLAGIAESLGYFKGVMACR